MTGDLYAARRQRRLEQAGFKLEPTAAGKRYWRTPESGELVSEDHAAAMLKNTEEQTLEAAGWEHEDIEGETYWRRPSSRHLYPREAAYDVLRAARGEEAGL